MTLDDLKKIVDNVYVTQELVDGLNVTFEVYDIFTNLRKCHFLAQIIHESGRFRYKEEIADGSAYEGRKDLGNVYEGDGKKYKGRGLIQITGRFNYQKLTDDLRIDFINNPEKLEDFPYYSLSAGWYWDSRSLNQYADKDDIVAITKKINGGLNGFDDRKKWFEICKSVLN